MSPETPRRGLALHWRIFIGLAIGIGAGCACNHYLGPKHPQVVWVVSHLTRPLGDLFIRLLFMTVVPLVFASLVVGIAGLGDVRKLGRVGFKAFGYCAVISAISVVIGLTLANTIRPGQRMDRSKAALLQEQFGGQANEEIEKSKTADKSEPALSQIIKTLVPKNPITAIASETPNMLHLMFFTVVFGAALALAPASKTRPLLAALEGVYAVSATVIDLIMKAAPYAVACLLFSTTAILGFGVLVALSWFVVTVLLGLGLHLFGTYSISTLLLSRISPLEFFWRIKTVMVTAFSTSSSVATLPTTLRVSEENLGVPRDINGFVLTVGATANQNGTALYEGVTVLFLAQLAGVDLTLGQQLTVAGLAILGGIGTAGVPSASIPFIVIVAAGVGVNPALIGVILGVDRILDMCRTVVNVVGDMTAATYVARSEGSLLFNSKTALEPLVDAEKREQPVEKA